MNIELMAIISVIAFLLASFFAASETAIIAAERVRLRHRARAGDRRARMVLEYAKNPEYFLSVVLVGTNLGMIGCTATFTAIMIELHGDSGATLATLFLVPTLLIFQEIIPKAIFLYYADRASILCIVPLKAFAGVLFPIVKTFSAVSNLLARLFGVGRMGRKVTMTMEELLFHLRGSTEAGLISSETMELAARASKMAHFTAGDVMVSFERVVMEPAGLSREEYRAAFVRERFSRLPIYEGDKQNVVGFLSIHGLLGAPGKQQEVAFESPYVVGVDEPIAGILARMKNHGCHMAMVRGKRGKIVGMTTLEDILERLVGAIADEFH